MRLLHPKTVLSIIFSFFLAVLTSLFPGISFSSVNVGTTTANTQYWSATSIGTAYDVTGGVKRLCVRGWFHGNASTSDNTCLMGRENLAGNQGDWIVGFLGSGKNPGFRINNGAEALSWTGLTFDFNWHYYEFCYDGQAASRNVQVFYDGVMEISGAYTSDVTNNFSELVISNYWDGTFGSQGNYYAWEVRPNDRGNWADVANGTTVYTPNQCPTPDGGSAGFWAFSEGTGTTVADTGTGGKALTAFGATSWSTWANTCASPATSHLLGLMGVGN